MHELKIYRGILCNDTEERWKIWKEIDLSFQNWHKEFDEYWLEHWRASKIYILGCFWPKYIMFELKKYRGIIFHGTRKWCKIWGKSDLWFGKSHEELCKFLLEQMKVSKLGLLLSPFIQTIKCMSLKFTGELCVMTMKYDAKFEKELTCRFIIDMRNFTNFDLTWPAKKTQRSSYVWWHWILMQNLKKN